MRNRPRIFKTKSRVNRIKNENTILNHIGLTINDFKYLFLLMKNTNIFFSASFFI